MGALCENLGNFALNSFDDTSLLVDGHVLHFFFDSCLHLDTVLKLLAYCYFITGRHHGFDVVLEVDSWKPTMCCLCLGGMHRSRC